MMAASVLESERDALAIRVEELRRENERLRADMADTERARDESRAELARLAPAWHVAAVSDNPATLRAQADALERGAREGADAAMAVRECIAGGFLPAETLALLGQARLGRSIHATHARNLREQADALDRARAAAPRTPDEAQAAGERLADVGHG